MADVITNSPFIGLVINSKKHIFANLVRSRHIEVTDDYVMIRYGSSSRIGDQLKVEKKHDPDTFERILDLLYGPETAGAKKKKKTKKNLNQIDNPDNVKPPSRKSTVKKTR